MRIRKRGRHPWLRYGLGIGLIGAALGLLLSYEQSARIYGIRGLSQYLTFNERSTGLVAHVIDGDTIELSDGVKIRYIGVDAPELRRRVQGRWMYRPQRFAEDAKAFNRGLVERKIVRLEYDEETTDRFDRTLAYVYVEDLFVNAELIRSGYARVVLRPPNLRYSTLFLELEKEAKKNRKGMWSSHHQSTGLPGEMILTGSNGRSRDPGKAGSSGDTGE